MNANEFLEAHLPSPPLALSVALSTDDIEKVSEWMTLVRKAERRQMLLDLWDALSGHEASGDCAGSLRAMLLLSKVGDEIRQTRTGRLGEQPA